MSPCGILPTSTAGLRLSSSPWIRRKGPSRFRMFEQLGTSPRRTIRRVHGTPSPLLRRVRRLGCTARIHQSRTRLTWPLEKRRRSASPSTIPQKYRESRRDRRARSFRFQGADNDLISVSEQHVDESEAGSLEQPDPSRDRHLVSNAIGLLGAEERRVVVAEERVGLRPEPLPVLARVARRLPGLPLFESSREWRLRTGGLCDQEEPASPQRRVNVLNELHGPPRVEPMQRVDDRHDIVVAWKLARPAILLEVSHDERSGYAIPLIDGSADRREERVSIDAVDVRLRVHLSDGSARVPWAAT